MRDSDSVYKPLILVVDDRPESVELMTRAFVRAGMKVMSATSAEAGLELARVVMPDLIVSDIKFPRMSGLEFAQLLRGDSNTRHIKLVAVTSQTIENDHATVIEAGFDAYLEKPLDPYILAAQIREYL